MKIIIPNKITLSSCSVVETDAIDGVEWNSSTTYGLNTLVRKNHVTYKSMMDNNVGYNPEQNYQGDNPSWLKVGATMPWRMIDDYVETKTYAPAGQTLTFSVPFSRADSFALMNMGGQELHMHVEENNGTVLFDETLTLTHDITNLSLYEYYFTLVDADNITVRTDIPVAGTGTMTVSITPQSNSHQPYISHVIVGRNWYLGETKYPAEIGITDYSKKSQDDFGVTTFVRRSYSRNASVSVFVPPFKVNAISKVLSDLRSTPLFIEAGNNDSGEEALSIFGWIEDWRCVYQGPNENELRMEIQGLI